MKPYLTLDEAAGILSIPVVPDRQISPDEGLSRREWQERLDDFNAELDRMDCEDDARGAVNS